MAAPLTCPVAIASPLRQTFDYLLPAGVTPSIGMRVQVPFGRRREVGIVCGTAGPSPIAQGRLRAIEAVLDDTPAIDAHLMELCHWAAKYYHHPIGDVLSHALPVLLRSAAHTVDAHDTVWVATEKGLLSDPAPLRRAPRQWAALNCLRDHPAGLTVGLLRETGIEPQALRQLEAKGLAFQERRQTPCTDFERPTALAEPALTPSDEQASAIQRINNARGFQPLLLAGITGSGKTEVYLHAIAHCLSQGRQALVLVPEIGLTPQTLARFRRRFSVPVVALHSGLSDHERLTAWRQARAGACGIVIGTRSALFTPLKNPGILIVDEEHDGSFKQQDGFRYSARDLALVRARLLDIPIVLGSATPSLESLHNADAGKYLRLDLTRRAGVATPPRFRLLDLRAVRLEAGLSPEAIQATADALKRREQVMCFINRRGFAPSLLCHDCGWHADCRRCSAHLTLHRQPSHLRCHHCDAQAAIPRLCPECGSTDLRPAGQGTEQVDAFLRQRFPDVPVIRIDRDSTSSRHALAEKLAQIQRGDPCLLVGTQMLAKGHHFPHVTRVIILNVDGGLFSANFRALEQCGQLIEQVAGRAGRAEHAGEVLLQTHHPDHPALHTLMGKGYLALAREILIERQLVGLPPFGQLAVMRAEAHRENDARQFLMAAREAGEGLTSATVDLLGPLPAMLERRAGRHRFQLVVKSSSRPALHAFVAAWLPRVDALPGQHRARWHLDVDPIALDD